MIKTSTDVQIVVLVVGGEAGWSKIPYTYPKRERFSLGVELKDKPANAIVDEHTVRRVDGNVKRHSQTSCKLGFEGAEDVGVGGGRKCQEAAEYGSHHTRATETAGEISRTAREEAAGGNHFPPPCLWCWGWNWCFLAQTPCRRTEPALQDFGGADATKGAAAVVKISSGPAVAPKELVAMARKW